MRREAKVLKRRSVTWGKKKKKTKKKKHAENELSLGIGRLSRRESKKTRKKKENVAARRKKVLRQKRLRGLV